VSYLLSKPATSHAVSARLHWISVSLSSLRIERSVIGDTTLIARAKLNTLGFPTCYVASLAIRQRGRGIAP
jgi:hypothetical protein